MSHDDRNPKGDDAPREADVDRKNDYPSDGVVISPSGQAPGATPADFVGAPVHVVKLRERAHPAKPPEIS